jgi:hypothetical protein
MFANDSLFRHKEIFSLQFARRMPCGSSYKKVMEESRLEEAKALYVHVSFTGRNGEEKD